jgi:ribosomal protein L37AE/L43A
MSFDAIPEDKELSYPCPNGEHDGCTGSVTQKGAIWECDKCDFSFLAVDTLDHMK